MHRVGLEQEVIERRLVEGLSLLAGPVMAQRAIGRLAGSAWLRRPQFHHVQNLLVAPTVRGQRATDVCTGAGQRRKV